MPWRINVSHPVSSVTLTQSHGLASSSSWLCSRPNRWAQSNLHIPSGSSLHFSKSALKIFWWNILGFMSIYFLINPFYITSFSLLSTVKFSQSPFVIFTEFVPTYLIHLILIVFGDSLKIHLQGKLTRKN